MARASASIFESRNKAVDMYYDPDTFLQSTSKYNKDTIILMDHNLENAKLNGLDVLKQLHELGFTRLYLFSVSIFEKDQIPDYVIFISKNDVSAVIALADE